LLIVDAFKTAPILDDGLVRYQSVLHFANRRPRFCIEGECFVGQKWTDAFEDNVSNRRTDSVTERSERSAERARRELESFLRDRKYLSPREVLRPNIDIRWKLGIDGDDAVAFIPDFFETFQIQQGDFSYAQYFAAEGFSPFSAFLTLLFALFFKSYRQEVRQQRQASAVTPKMLQRAIELGVWDSRRLKETDGPPSKE
jgi:hypothetical protein